MTAGWNIDLAHSSIRFSVRHMVVAKVRGRFSKWQGRIDLNEQDLTRSRVTAEIDATSIDTGVADRDAYLRSADFLNVEQFPTLRFESHRVEALARKRYRVVGALTIRDVTREVTLDAKYGGRSPDRGGKHRVAFTAKAARRLSTTTRG